MADDIVTRLREDFCDFGQWENSCTPEGRCPCCLAADEIERLRAEVSRWKQLAITDHLDVCNLDDHELCLSYLEWKISQAVRGE